MFCNKCGKPIQPSHRFCRTCGTPNRHLATPESKPAPTWNVPPQTTVSASATPTPDHSKRSIVLVVAASLLVLIIILFLSFKPVIELIFCMEQRHYAEAIEIYTRDIENNAFLRDIADDYICGDNEILNGLYDTFGFTTKDALEVLKYLDNIS